MDDHSFRLGDHERYHAMNAVSIISALIVMATIISYFAVTPASTTIHVGDDGDRVNEIGRYGYVKSIFSLRHNEDTDGKPLRPSAFSIGPDGYHLLIWRNDKIDSMTHFRHERSVPNTYGDWHDVNEVDSFTVDRPSPIPFFVGIAVLGVAGYVLKRFRRTIIVLYALAVLFVTLMIVGISTLAETFAIIPMLIGIGWLAAPILGRSLANNRQPPAELA
ncbi:hypothetical protein N9Z44_02625 [Mariniblastus sp.]|nr:hypothetical protein [Mariniblastus sp.]